MKEVDELMESMGEMTAYMQQYVEQKVELTKLEVAEKSALLISELVTAMVIGLIGVVVLLLMTITIGLFLADWLGSYAWAFLSLSLFFVLVGIVTWIFRRRVITNPVVGMVVARLFK